MRNPAVYDQLWDEAPCRAWDWLSQVREGVLVPRLRDLNPILRDAVETWRMMAKHEPAPRFHRESPCDWQEWFRRDGRCWDGTRIPFDRPFDGVTEDEQPGFVAAQGRGGMQRVIVTEDRAT